MLVNRLFFGVRGSSHLYDDAVRWAYMLTEKAKHKAKILVFWEKHGLAATMDAFSVKRSTLFLWKKQFKENNNVWEALRAKPSSENQKEAIMVLGSPAGNQTHQRSSSQLRPEKDLPLAQIILPAKQPSMS